MKKIVFLSCFVALGYALSYAGDYVNGVNQIAQLLDKIEQGTGEAPPVTPINNDGGTDSGKAAWTSNSMTGLFSLVFVTPPYLDNGTYTYWAYDSINFANQGYKQIEETVISLVQPDMFDFDYGSVPDGYDDLSSFWDRNDLSSLEFIDFSGNDFTNLEIDGGPYGEMPLKTLNLSNNPNLTSLSIIHCEHLELLDITGTSLSAAAIDQIKADVLELSPDCVIKADAPNAIPVINVATPAVYTQGDMLYIKDKAPGVIVTVFDLSGKTLITSADNAINLGSFGNGVYLVKVNGKVTKVLKK